MDEIWKQIIIGVSGVILALAGLIPAFLKHAQERRKIEDLQSIARRALDVAGDCLALVDRQNILSSDVDDKLTTEAKALHEEYDEIWADYRGRPRRLPDAPTNPIKT